MYTRRTPSGGVYALASPVSHEYPHTGPHTDPHTEKNPHTEKLGAANMDQHKTDTHRPERTPIEIGDYFARLRKNPRHHLGLGDVRLTLAQQDDLVGVVEGMRRWIEIAGEVHGICTRHVLGQVCPGCRCGKSGV